MWFLRNLIWLVIMVLVVGFAILNVNETVSAIHLPGHLYHQVNANAALFIAFVIGMLTALCLTLFHHVRARNAMGRVNRENANLRRELDQLRNLALEDLDVPKESRAGRG